MIQDRRFKLRLRLAGDKGVVMGPGRADLLALIMETGSISAAGRQMGMSYRRAWSLVESMNTTFAAPLVETSKGGAGHGGARLTALGCEMLTAYRDLEAVTLAAGREALDRIGNAMVISAPADLG